MFQLEHSQRLPEEDLLALQLAQLKLVLRHAQSTVPHYAKILCGQDINALGWESFRALPVLTRKAMQAGFESLKSNAIPQRHGAVTQGASSGSTGMPVRFLHTSVSQLFWYALTLREHLWQERDLSGKLAAIRVKTEEGYWPDWGRPAATVFRTGPMATLNVRTDVEKQLDWLIRENPDHLITHASNLLSLAELSLRRGVRLPRLRQVRSYSETLRSGLRDTVRAAWGVEVVDIYSCEEVGYIALQCPRHEHYHVQAENLLAEILDDAGQPCRPGETGRVVVTPLHNFAMPLIRYEIGDYAEVGAPCDCGRSLPVLARIHGRRRNMMLLPDGRRHWPSFPSALWLKVAPIEQFQITQTTLESLQIRYVMGRTLTAEEQAALEAALAEKFGYSFRFAWIRADFLQRTANAKYEDFVSLPSAVEG